MIDGMRMEMTDPGIDLVQPFQIERTGLRGRVVRLGSAVDALLAPNAYPAPVASLLAEAMALAAVLASGLKFDGVFTLQLQGDGPVPLLVVDVTSGGDLRGYARFDEGRLAAGPPFGDAPVPRLLGAGHMAFTVDQGPATNRYQGITPLEGATLSDIAHTYFRQSEQLQTAIRLAAFDPATPNPPKRAAALMIQRLPPDADAFDADVDWEEEWRRAVILMSSVTPAELLAPDLAAPAVLYRLFHEDGIRIFRPRPLRYRCRCSSDRVMRMLHGLARSDRHALSENGVITVTCEFCKAVYRASDKDLDAPAEDA
jgi:molecular chaperone Hsp33